MSRAAWSAAFSHAYEDFCAKVDSDEALLDLDDYAAESPAEFFAVMSEAFFESPQTLSAMYPDVYAQLVQFYRQDPAARMPQTGSALAEPSIDP
jgi:Mlc titration factor MtfA (ptsG expression regulator)